MERLEPESTNSRFQDVAAAGLSAASVKNLKLKWSFNLGNVGVARAQPVIVGGRLFTTAQSGAAFALDAATGCRVWRFQADVGIRSGVTFGDANGTPAVFFGDARGTMYALDANNGHLIWKSKLVRHPASIVTATPRFYNGVIYQPISSFEEALAAKPDYQCCTFRGSVVAIEAGTGKTIWQGFSIAQEPAPTHKGATGVQQYGPSGAGIWSTATIDPERDALYVTTGDNYSDPPTNTSDAVLAMDLKTGQLLWSQQFTSGDAFNNSCSTPGRANCPSTAGPDADFGQPPILVRLDDGNRELRCRAEVWYGLRARPRSARHGVVANASGRGWSVWRQPMGFGFRRAKHVRRDLWSKESVVQCAIRNRSSASVSFSIPSREAGWWRSI